ncbi:unnamed protein product [Clavelina lepadiformis]|uniref:Connexin N-terminal domain-containing protein n=1 Tax=Clavelina lepadiformis TaxID=159417 RepID=A0ABP0H3S5_CLALP
MWGTLEKITDQIVKYSTFFGQFWYILVFLFRLIVVATVGGAVYGDEQSALDCNTKSPGCKNACFDKFTRISHLRFWSFQLIAITFPAVLFHFFSLYISSQVAKIESKQESPKELENGNVDEVRTARAEKKQVWEDKKTRQRKKIVGKYKHKEVYSGGGMKKIPVTLSISIAYFVTTILRLVIEAVFLYLGSILYGDFEDPFCNPNDPNTECYSNEGVSFVWGFVPPVYICHDEPNTLVGEACRQHIGTGFGDREKKGFVTCWISRPWEKTLFLRYMNVLSAACFILCCLEIVYLPVKAFLAAGARNRSYRNAWRDRRYRHDYPNDDLPPSNGNAITYANPNREHNPNIVQYEEHKT